jgi:hypothetical protein
MGQGAMKVSIDVKTIDQGVIEGAIYCHYSGLVLKVQAVFIKSGDYNKLRVGDYDPIKLNIHQT